MKRFTAIALLLSMALLAFPMFIPASAAETSGNYFNVLDYTGYDDGLSNTFDVEGSTTICYNLSTYLGSFPVYGVELTYSYVGVQPTISSFKLNNSAFSVTSSSVSSGLVRVRGDLSGAVGESFTITFDASVTTVTIHSFNVYTVGVSDAPISGTMYAGGSSQFFDGSTEIEFYPSSDSDLEFRTDWWRNYDYMELFFNAQFLGLNSVSVYLFETDTDTEYVVPFEINPIYPEVDDTNGLGHDIQLHIDLTGFDHNSIGDAILCVQFYFDSELNNTNRFILYSFRGFVFSDPLDADLKWNQILFNNLSNWFLSVYSAISNLDQNITESFDYWFGRLNTWFSSLRSGIISSISSLDKNITNSFDSWFSSLEGWISDQTDTIIVKLEEMFDSSELQQSVDDLNSSVADFEQAASDRNFEFEGFSSTVDEADVFLKDNLSRFFQYLDAASDWGLILQFCWSPLPGFSEFYIIIIACFFLISVVLVKR